MSIFESKKKKEERMKMQEMQQQEMQRQAILEQQRIAQQQQIARQEVLKYYEQYKNDNDVLKMMSEFIKGNTNINHIRRGSPEEWLRKTVSEFKNYVDTNTTSSTQLAYIQYNNEYINFVSTDGKIESGVEYRDFGFNMIENPNKQKAVAMVFLECFKQKALEFYLLEGLNRVNVEYRFEKVYNYRRPYDDYPLVGLADTEYINALNIENKKRQSEDEKAYFESKRAKKKGEHYYYYPKGPIEANIQDGAIITIINNQVNHLREL